MSDECQAIHEMARALPRFEFPFDEKEIPSNGIYILFEKGETGHGGDRIVRIGTHTGKSQLRSRLKQHFLNENKDRSIFRKNIGRAMLNRDHDSFLGSWELDLTTRAARAANASIDSERQKSIEKQVSDCIRNRFSFCVFEVNDKDARLEIESKLISTISWCTSCQPSADWLGNHSPKMKIAESGLWLVNELYKKPFDAEGIEGLSSLLSYRNAEVSS